MKKSVLLFAFMLTFTCLFSQNRQYYYLEIKEGFELGTVQKTVNTDQTLTLSMANTNFAGFLNTKSIYHFEKAFPTAETPRLQRVYVVSLNENAPVNDFLTKTEVEKFIAMDDEVIIENDVVENNSFYDVYHPQSILPNDYDDIITGGRNTALDLIRAPQAWAVTQGNPNVLVGVVDASYDLNHEDLDGQIFDHIIINNNTVNHGTGVASIIAAKTNNNKGMASIGYNTRLVVATAYDNINHTIAANSLINGLLVLSQYPGVRVVNCSWAIPQGNQSRPYLDLVMEEVNENGVLVVAGAGNVTTTTYFYPASYDETISVTSVGHRFYPEYYDSTFGISWKDCHANTHQSGSQIQTHTHNDKVDVSAPGWHVIRANRGGGYNVEGGGTSSAAPFVSGVAALMLAANPGLTPQQIRDIIRDSADDIYHIPCNEPYIGLLGTGRVNAYRAVLTAKCMADPGYAPGLDLMIRNSLIDYGEEPDNHTQEVLWNSPDIWVRHNSEESYIDVHQNPEYDPVVPNYVNVRVTNRSCATSTGNEELTLYWAKANTALNWPSHWDGTLTMADITDSNSTTPVGGVIGTLNIPPLEPGQEAILEFEWLVPNPEDYFEINENPWHFCLLARIESPDDPMTFPESWRVLQNVKNNNNIAWKNTTVVDIVPNTPTGVGGVVAVSNPFSFSRSYRLELFTEANEPGKPIYEEAEIGIEMDQVLFEAWERGNREGDNFKTTGNEKRVIATENHVILDNILFNPDDYGTAYITFNFLTKELTDKSAYTYHVVQRDLTTGDIIGGETYEIRKQPRPGFLADAGGDKEIERSESVTLQAGTINEDAVYNWYDFEGNLIYTGTAITVSPQFTQQYKLEVISNLDGLKDYDELEVTVNPYKIESLVPNPAATQVTVNYIADEAASAYLMFVNQSTGSSDNYILDTTQNAITVDLSIFPSGLYSVILVCDGEIQGSKNLAKQ